MIFDLTDAQAAFQAAAERFATERVAPRAAAIDEDARFPRELIAEAASRGLLGATIAKEWGGAGADDVSYAVALEALAKASAVVSAIASVNNSLVAEPIAAFGTDAQKQTWLRPLASGEALGAFALSEEHAGSDAANQQTVAHVDDRGYVLDGRKVWVANAEVADVAIVFAATDPAGPPTDSGRPERTERVERRSVGAFLVPLDTPGVSRAASSDSLGVRGLGCVDLELKAVRLGTDALLGGPRDGFQIAMWALDGGRVAIAAQALGVGQAALDAAIAHAKRREAFGQPIGNYQAIQWMLADTATELDAARMLVLRAADSRARTSGAAGRPARAGGRRDRLTLEAAMAKLAASEAAHRAADRAMQILASQGYRRGSVVERLFRDVRATEIYQGTSEVQRMVIAEQVLG
ncbi:MAG TPA: acyl-CoA dehydrogenase family protein [Vicinamibacterales bacterium]|jgi:butyryl-CoA dehydrogenase|nr:acyl-CoA dehydrogenase family protein [Vicinamibacterales bacterium]